MTSTLFDRITMPNAHIDVSTPKRMPSCSDLSNCKDASTNIRCTHIVQWNIATVFISTTLTEAILQIRIYALYNKSRKILFFLLFSCAATTSVSVWIMAEDLMVAVSQAVDIPGGKTCTFPMLPPRAYLFWVPFNIYDTILCGFAIYRGYKTFTSSIGPRGSLGRRLLNVMNVYIEIPGAFMVTLCYVLSNRMILNIRDTASKPSHTIGSSSSNFIDLSDMSHNHFSTRRK
ncbi:hypothetical protein D9613_007349 [Agrocybe pediades]|uniref:Uncharacterized protein n=1 Tax=Agrocybe pediades TaxID=84607 RepID=A0A8H4VKE2_9AGAR|nr:hypothetical protein D9613_007349 [Agrocybe pediades]